VTSGDDAAPATAPTDDTRPASSAPSLVAHPPALPGLPSLDDSYRALVATLPRRLRELAQRLPWRLGLTESPDGGWGDFVGLHPNRDLPIYAAQAPGGGLDVAEADLACFLRAHHVGGFSWLLRDRLADGQVGPDIQLVELAQIFGDRWRSALAVAMGDAALADGLCERAAARWERGTEAEQRLLEAGSVRAPIYAAVVKEKLSWIGVPSQGLLLAHGKSRRATAFLHAHDLFMLGLQAIDDVVDMEQDRTLRGHDVPSALRCSPAALVRVAPKLLQRAAAAASGGGFGWFATWLEAFARATRAWQLDGNPLVDELDAIGIAGEIEEAVVSAGDRLVRFPTPPRAAAAPA
jgi:hypothetical protein